MDVEPPERLSEAGKQAWREVTARLGRRAADVVGADLEVYCEAVARSREAFERVAAEGMIVADPRGTPMPHPALGIMKQAEATIAKLGPRFAAPVSRGRDGYMVRKTRESAVASGLRDDPRFAAPLAAATTLALIIDEAQEEGIEALRRSAFGPIPTYLKLVRDLGWMPTVTAVDGAAEAQDGASGAGVGSGASPVDLGAWRAAQGG